MVPTKMNQNWLPSIFNDFFNNEWMMKANATAPAINVIENEKDYKIQLAAPGMTKNDFTVNVDEWKRRKRRMRRKKTKNTYVVNSLIPNSNKVSYCRTMLKKIRLQPR